MPTPTSQPDATTATTTANSTKVNGLLNANPKDVAARACPKECTSGMTD
jgi:hypothetical protein